MSMREDRKKNDLKTESFAKLESSHDTDFGTNLGINLLAMLHTSFVNTILRYLSLRVKTLTV